MALSRTSVGQWASATSYGTGSYATGSFTPPANSLLLVFVSMMGDSISGDLGQPSISGGSLSYTLLGSARGDASWSHRINVFTAPVGASPSAMTITVDDNNNQNIYNYVVTVLAYTGHNTTTPTAGYVTSGTSDIGNGSETQTLAATPASADETLYCLTVDADNLPNPTLAAGWSELYDGGQAGGATTMVAVRTGSTSTSVTLTDSYTGGGTYYKAAMLSFIVKCLTATTYTSSVSGALTPAGAYVQQIGLRETGALTPVAALALMTATVKAGGVTPVSELSRRVALGLVGGLAPAGDLLRAVALGLVGGLAPAGDLLRAVALGLVGGLAPAGDLVRAVALGLAGGLAPAGDLVRAVALAVAGAVAPWGGSGAIVPGLVSRLHSYRHRLDKLGMPNLHVGGKR